MVRAGVVSHPAQWKWGGYNEIQNPKGRYCLIDHHRLHRLLNVAAHHDFTRIHNRWVESKLATDQVREDHFSRSLAVGSESFVTDIQAELGVKAMGRGITLCPDGSYQLREPGLVYTGSSSTSQQLNEKDMDGTNQIPWTIGLS
jgi:putative transposase